MGGLIAAGIYKGLHKDADSPLVDDDCHRNTCAKITTEYRK